MFFDYAKYEYFLSAALLVSAMFGMGTTLLPSDFLRVLRAPFAILLIVALQLVIAPLLAVGTARIFFLPPEIAVGLLLVVALPGGLFSNVLTLFGQGNVALSVSATAICSLACLVTTTLVLKTFGSTQLPSDFAMPVGYILFEIGCCVLIPLLLGMLFHRLLPTRSARVSRLCVRASAVMLTLVILGAVLAGRIHLTEYGWRTPLAIVLFQVALLWICYGVSLLFRMPLTDVFTISLEVVLRNSHLGVFLTSSLFPPSESQSFGDGIMFVVLFYGGVSLALGVGEVIGIRRRWGLYKKLPR